LPVGAAGVTVLNTENACASGSSALEICMAYVRAGMARVAVAVGVERPSDLGSSVPLPAWDRLAGVGITHPVRYALEAEKYCAEFGVDRAALAGVTVKNRAHAARNPAARFQSPVSAEEVLAAAVVATPTTRLMCCANADGAAAAVVTTPDVAAGIGADPVRIRALESGSGNRVDRPAAVSMTERLAARAFDAAGVTAGDIDVAEIYDAFVILEIRNAERLGFAKPGTAALRIADGDFTLGAGLGPVLNPGGGLLGRGHPLGATGLAQVAEIVDQLRHRAGGRQVDDCQLGLVQTMGGNVRELESNAGVVMVLSR
ncbi:MAG TPA: thiolase family protein, partial [Acidimicrobiia bacterium]|nr:thiolase family protein [Acidimicrobiia bacterium]